MVHGPVWLDAFPGDDRFGEYAIGQVQFAWEAWRAARPERSAVGRLISLAADCAQRKPLRGLEPLTEMKHIGRRQFGRAYEQVDEAVRKMACDIRDAADAIGKVVTPLDVPRNTPIVEA
jgi:hypothetical protein